MYAQTLTDPEVLSVLRSKSAGGVRVRVLLGGAKTVKGNGELAQRLRGWGIGAAAQDDPYVHAKAAMADGARAYVGSANYTANSLDRNREAGLLLGPAGTAALGAAFEADFRASGGR